MKQDNKNILKLQISTYLEESLSMVGRMMLEDLFNTIEAVTDDEATTLVNKHYDDNIFDIIAPYLLKAAEEYEIYKNSPEGSEAIMELKEVIQQARESAIKFNKVKNNVVKPSGDGEGNVH